MAKPQSLCYLCLRLIYARIHDITDATNNPENEGLPVIHGWVICQVSADGEVACFRFPSNGASDSPPCDPSKTKVAHTQSESTLYWSARVWAAWVVLFVDEVFGR
jgi:hypothetical protein